MARPIKDKGAKAVMPTTPVVTQLSSTPKSSESRVTTRSMERVTKAFEAEQTPTRPTVASPKARKVNSKLAAVFNEVATPLTDDLLLPGESNKQESTSIDVDALANPPGDKTDNAAKIADTNTANSDTISDYTRDSTDPRVIQIGNLPDNAVINTWKLAYGDAPTETHLFFMNQENELTEKWFSVTKPTLKEYPYVASTDYSTTCKKKGLNLWLVNNDLSKLVREYFPGVLDSVLHPFWVSAAVPGYDLTLELEDESERANVYNIDHLRIFQFGPCFTLDLGNPNEDNKKLEKIANVKLPLTKTEEKPEIKFRQLAMPNEEKRVWCVYTHEPTDNVLDKSPFVKNANKIRDFFNSTSLFEIGMKFTRAEQHSFKTL